MLKRRVPLPNDFIQMCGPHPCFLKLLEGPSCFYALMLAGVPYKQDSVIFFQAMQEFVHLLCAGETGLVEHVEMLCHFWRLIAASKMSLQCARLNTCLREFMRSTGRRREAAHLVAFSIGSFPDSG